MIGQRTRKGVEYQLPAGSHQLPAGASLGCLPGCRNQRADQCIIVINIHPQVLLCFKKRDWLLSWSCDQLQWHLDDLHNRCLITCIGWQLSRIDAQDLRCSLTYGHTHSE